MSEIINLDDFRHASEASDDFDEFEPFEVEAANDCRGPFNLFDATCWTGAERPANDKPRKATGREAALYCAELATRAGLQPFDDYNLVPGPYARNVVPSILGVTFGDMIEPARCERVEVPDYETFTMRPEYRDIPAQFEEGAYSVPMPGAGAREVVTLELLDEAGDVVSSSTLPTDGKRQVVWSRDAVRKAVGPVEKPKKARGARRKAVEPQEAVEVAPELVAAPEALSEPQGEPQDAVEAIGNVIGQMFAMMATRLDAIEARLASPPVENAPPPVESGAANPKRSPARERLLRRYLAMRAERKALREAVAKQSDRFENLRKSPVHSVPADPGIIAQLHQERRDAAEKVNHANNRADALERAVDRLSEEVEQLSGRAIRAEQALQLYRVREAVPVGLGGMRGARVSYEVRS